MSAIGVKKNSFRENQALVGEHSSWKWRLGFEQITVHARWLVEYHTMRYIVKAAMP